jgi:hypothetical protein
LNAAIATHSRQQAAVIASEAKQSRAAKDWIASSLALLAMTMRLHVPRMLRSAPPFAAWCAADPGS